MIILRSCIIVFIRLHVDNSPSDEYGSVPNGSLSLSLSLPLPLTLLSPFLVHFRQLITPSRLQGSNLQGTRDESHKSFLVNFIRRILFLLSRTSLFFPFFFFTLSIFLSQSLPVAKDLFGVQLLRNSDK